MCLDKLIWYDKIGRDMAAVASMDGNKYPVGYKVFKICKGKLLPQFYDQWIKLSIGKWIKAGTARTITCEKTHEQYMSGFHIFLSEYGAMEWYRTHDPFGDLTIRKVSYRNATVMGTQQGYEIIVAGEMKIHETWLEKFKRWITI